MYFINLENYRADVHRFCKPTVEMQCIVETQCIASLRNIKINLNVCFVETPNLCVSTSIWLSLYKNAPLFMCSGIQVFMFLCVSVFVCSGFQVEKALCNELCALSCLLMIFPKTTNDMFL